MTGLKTVMGGKPWALIGDFNCIRVPEERMGSEEMDIRAMEEFNQFIDEMDTEEYSRKWFYYTWCNQRENEDRI